MGVKDSKTEQLIKDTAIRLYLKEGNFLATTQDIADAAGVNRTLLHYYFRSRDALFDSIFKEATRSIRGKIDKVLASPLPFAEKIKLLVDEFFKEQMEYPYLQTLVSLHINLKPDKYNEFFESIPGGREQIRLFLKEIQQEMDNGKILPMKPYNYFINIFALLAYPFVSRPLYLNLFDINDAAYAKLLAERKKVVLSMLLCAPGS